MIQYPRYSMQQYLNIRTAYFPSFSADGSHVAFLTDVTGTPQVWMANVDRQAKHALWPEQLTFSDERVSWVQFSPVDKNTLFFARDKGGNENAQLYLLSLETGLETSLCEGFDDVMHTPGGWLPDGKSFLFAANRRNAELFDVYVQPLGGEARLVWENQQPGFMINLIFSPDGRRALTILEVNSSRHDLYEIELSTGKARLLSSQDTPAVYGWADYAANGISLLITTDLNSDFIYLASMDLQTGKITPLIQENADVEMARLSPDRRRLVYAFNRGGVSGIYLLELVTGRQYQAPAIGRGPGLLASMTGNDSVQFSPDSSTLAIAYTGACIPADIWLWDWQTDSVQPVTRSSTAGINRQSFAEPELVHYPTFDMDPASGSTRMIPAWLFLPPERKGPLPVVVHVHGGPEGQYRPNLHAVAQYFVNQGFAVLATNVRGSSGYGKEYRSLDDVEKRMDSVNDLAHAALWLKAQPEFDSEKIAVMGASYGGFMVLASLTAYPDLWAAGVDIVGLSNFVTFLENTSGYRRAHRAAEYGTLEYDREFMESIAPSNHLDKIKAPLMVIHGRNDPRVPVTETLQIVQKLEARGVPVQSMIFEDEGHGLVKLKNKLAAYPEIARFLKKHLGIGQE
ncbi:MAG: S9 family peptidase [Chloroflexi bacterium]|nr:S9 family peptidase [Chloroflexota bacterium]